MTTRLPILLFLLLLHAGISSAHLLPDDDLDVEYRLDHHTPVLPQQDPRNKERFTEQDFQNSRLLQDNPFSPTGQIMATIPGTKPNDEVLTIELLNQIAQQSGVSTKPNITTNNTPNSSLSTLGNNISTLNITLSGLNYNYTNPAAVLGNQSWTFTTVDDFSNDPSWIAANGFLTKLNLSYFYPNQILILAVQKSSLGTAINVTYRSVRGFIQAVVLVNQSYVPTLIGSSILANLETVSVDASSILYNVTRSLLQSLFYDFTLAPLTLLNGTQTNFPDFTLFDLRYQSKNGMYNFIIRSQVLPNGSITGTALACNPITVSVATQTVPVLASINLIYVDANFKSVNKTVVNFIANSLNVTNFRIVYNSVVLWSNRAGSAILYYLNLTIAQSASNQTFLAGVSYNLTYRSQTITYWRSQQPPISPFNPNSTDYQQVGYLQILSNATFTNVDMSARANYPTVVVGPLTKIQVQRVGNDTGFKLTYFGVNGKNVQAAYKPSH